MKARDKGFSGKELGEEPIRDIVASYGAEVMALVQAGTLDKLSALTDGATAEIEARHDEISFKAGQREALSKDELILEMRREYEDKLKLAKQITRKEVAEWVERALLCHPDHRKSFRKEWQTQVQTWEGNNA